MDGPSPHFDDLQVSECQTTALRYDSRATHVSVNNSRLHSNGGHGLHVQGNAQMCVSSPCLVLNTELVDNINYGLYIYYLSGTSESSALPAHFYVEDTVVRDNRWACKHRLTAACSNERRPTGTNLPPPSPSPS